LEAQGRVDVPAGDECKEEVAPEDYRKVWEEVEAAGKGGMEDMAAATGREGGEGKLEAQGRVDVPAGDECKEEVAPEDYREVWEEVEAAGEEEMAEMEVGWASMAVSAGMGDMDRVLRVVRVAPTSTGRIAADTSGGSNCSSCSSCSRFYDYDVRRCRACTSRNIHLA